MQFDEATVHKLVQKGDLFTRVESGRYIICVACAHRCKIREGKSGICNVRYNDNNTLMVPNGYVAALLSTKI